MSTISVCRRKVLNISSGIDSPGNIKWEMALCLLLAWIVVYLCVCKGIKSSGKVMYVTATSPYLLMLALLIRGVTLPGSSKGIEFYLLPDWSKLLDSQVWVDAGTQVFFSYSIGLGTLTALGSYNKFHHNVFKDSLLFALTNSGTSFFSGFIIFSILGFMAETHGTTVDKVAESGPGLAFIAYPKTVGEMPGSIIWSICFFLMLILLGMDSQFGGVEGVVTAVVDQFPHLLRVGRRKEIFIAVICFVSYLVGLSMVTRGGIYVFQIFDYYSTSRIVLFIGFLECVTVGYLYGANRFWKNVEYMLGRKVFPLIKWSWMTITPSLALVIFIFSCIQYKELTYNKVYVYPRWAIALGWIIACSSLILIPIVAVVNLLQAEGSLTKRFSTLLKPKLKSHQLKTLELDALNGEQERSELNSA